MSNRLSEPNIATIVENIEALYREHRRHGDVPFDILDHFAHLLLDVTASITSLIVESISAHSALLDSFVVLHAALISSMYRLVGVEFGKATLFARCCDQLSL
jgi:nucleolar MIF4G domain-containing protein 1